MVEENINLMTEVKSVSIDLIPFPAGSGKISGTITTFLKDGSKDKVDNVTTGMFIYITPEGHGISMISGDKSLLFDGIVSAMNNSPNFAEMFFAIAALINQTVGES